MKFKEEEIEFNTVDNPGGWSQFIFRPEFDSTTKGHNYKGHFLPTGAIPMPVPSEVDGLGE